MTELIYIVDDDKDLRESVTEILQSDGYMVRSYAAAELALKELPSFPPCYCNY